MSKTFLELANNLRNTIRARAATIPDFETGAIMLSFVVKSDDGNQFLGGFCEEGDSNVDVDLIYSVRPNSPKTRPNGFRGMTDGEVACRGYAALKIEGCAYAVRNNLGRRSCDMPDEAISWGRENDRGAVCFDIMRCLEIYNSSYSTLLETHDPDLFLRVYIAVSGASGKEDEWCALAAADALKEWACSQQSKSAPVFPKNLRDHGYTHQVIEKWVWEVIEPGDEKEAE